jgi:hypothetical protein
MYLSNRKRSLDWFWQVPKLPEKNLQETLIPNFPTFAPTPLGAISLAPSAPHHLTFLRD